MCIGVGLVTHDMGLGTPLVLDQDRRCQTLGAVQNTVEEVPRRACCGDTVWRTERDTNSENKKDTDQINLKIGFFCKKGFNSPFDYLLNNPLNSV